MAAADAAAPLTKVEEGQGAVGKTREEPQKILTDQEGRIWGTCDQSFPWGGNMKGQDT